MGYSPGGIYSENDIWSGKPKRQARLTDKQATRRWVVKTRQSFSVVEGSEFQEMFIAYRVYCAYKNRFTLQNHIWEDYYTRRATLKLELEYDCISISFILDMWTAPNRKPIYAFIGHWWNNNFEEREEVLEFIEVTGSHDGPALAKHTVNLIDELNVRSKFSAFWGDNASNNGTLCDGIFGALKKTHIDSESLSTKPRMQFHRRFSWIHCFTHIIALICGDILKSVKAGTAKEAKKLLDGWEKEYYWKVIDILV